MAVWLAGLKAHHLALRMVVHLVLKMVLSTARHLVLLSVEMKVWKLVGL